ncbi:cytadherence-related protein ORF6 homolog [Mycoplasmoides pneumoniae]|nr:cytadherence-related protein ORF6 homolog [Mycoplasmoides pneumoniae]BAV20304.1 cytadherence-related protein ORF6 homolog [Mycoplasmoides pneumoniae]
MGSNAVPSLLYWVVGEDQESGRATWWAHTELNWGTDKQKQFVENQLGFKDDSNSDSKNSNLKAQGLTQPAYLIAGLDVVADHLVFAAFKAGAVGYDMSTENSAATKDQALAWSTTAGLDSAGGYKALVENTAGSTVRLMACLPCSTALPMWPRWVAWKGVVRITKKCRPSIPLRMIVRLPPKLRP